MVEHEPAVLVVEHPNREKAASRVTRAIVISLLLITTLLVTTISIGGWEKFAGARGLLIAYIVLYLMFAFFTGRWSRGVLPVASALAMVLMIFAAVAAPGWYARDKDGFAQTAFDPALLGLLCFILVPVQILLIAFAMRGFGQAWNVEAERPASKRPGRPGSAAVTV